MPDKNKTLQEISAQKHLEYEKYTRALYSHGLTATFITFLAATGIILDFLPQYPLWIKLLMGLIIGLASGAVAYYLSIWHFEHVYMLRKKLEAAHKEIDRLMKEIQVMKAIEYHKEQEKKETTPLEPPQLITNFLLTGAPSSGKTTVIKKVIEGLSRPANGFYTEEEREGERRVGFKMTTLDGRSDYLAHQDIESHYHIRRYGVSIENIETLAVPSIEPVDDNIIILDEIGKMECFSDVFKDAALRALNSSNTVIGTITFGGGDFIESLKDREDIEIL